MNSLPLPTSTERQNDTGLNDDVWNGLHLLLSNYVDLRLNDDVVIAYTPNSRDPAAWLATACESVGVQPKLVHMLPLRDKGFKDRISSIIPPQRISPGRLILFLLELDTMSHNKVIKSALAKYDPVEYRVIRAINSGGDLFSIGLQMHPDELSALNTTILERCRGSTLLRIETSSGTRLTAQLDNEKFHYISNAGIWRPGKFTVIPPGRGSYISM